ncbi:MAG TPA: TolC family protein [Thermoanaerobaculia bacterium]
MRLNPWKYREALLALALGVLAAGSAAAEEVRVSTTAARPAEAPALDIKDNAVQLSVDQAVRIALQQNLGLVIERYTRTQQRLGIIQNLGLYDLVAQATAGAQASEAPGVSQIQGTESNQQDFNFSFRQTIPTGGNVAFGWSNSRSEANSPLRANLLYSSGFSFTYNQPLLRDFGRLATERNILIARTNSRVSRQEFERQVTTTIQDVVNAYWTLVGAREQLVVAQQSLSLARELHERNRIQVEVGTLAPLEMVQSEAAIATREEDIIRSTSNIGDAEDQLRRLLNLPAVGGLWQTPIVPTTSPATERVTIDVDEAIRTAFAERPELRTQELQLEQARLDAEFFRNQLKPALDLSVNYGYGSAAPVFGTAFDQLSGFDFPDWSAQLVFSYPLQNRTARAQSAIANLDVDRVQTRLDEQKTVIATEVRRAARGVETAFKQIEAARVARQFQEKNLEAERKRYENGMSTSFQITQIQEDLTEARSREVTATINYRTALAEYYRATGRLLEHEGVAIDDPDEPDYAAQRFSFSRAPLPGEERHPGGEK